MSSSSSSRSCSSRSCSRRGVAAAALVALVSVACLAAGAHGHAVMIEPKSRAWFDYLLRYNYNPHAINGGGKAMVSDNGKLQWPARNLGSICGDEVGKNKWDRPGPASELGGTYKAGQTLKTDIVFAQNHLGRVYVRLCPLNAKSEGECTQLQRADGKGSSFELPWTKNWWGVTDGFVPPDNMDQPFGIYKMPPTDKSKGCAAWSCDQFKGMYVYSFAWKLPAGFTCEQCKLQMRYLTGSSCWPPCDKDQPDCTKPKLATFATCATPGASYPEEFWNCADVTIKA